ncbi:MAG: C4-type zinc ribbon domain-containing protein [Candidatus Eremiobacterota bacterium]
MKDLWKIYRLQAYENDLLYLREQISLLDPGKELEEKRNNASSLLKNARDKQETNNKRLKALGFETLELDKQIKTIEDKLYGGRPVNPKETAQWQKKIDDIKKKREAIDEESLTLIYDNEGLVDEIKKLEQDYQIIEEEYKKYYTVYEGELKDLNSRIEDIENKKKKIMESSTEELLKIYEDTKIKRGGIAIVALQKSFCTGCGMTLSERLVERAKLKMTLEYCEHCGRILYWEGDRGASQQPATSQA